jgi:hypothetical protein
LPNYEVVYVGALGSDLMHVSAYNHALKHHVPHMLDSGCSKEFTNWDEVRKHGFKVQKLDMPIILQMIDPKKTAIVRYYTWQTITIEGENGPRKFTIKYLVGDIAEDYILGKRWLTKVNPIVDWKKHTLCWRKRMGGEENTSKKHIVAAKAKIQSKIPANEPPSWVTRNFGRVFDDDIANSRLPRSRGELDYHFELKPHEPWHEKSRHFNPRKRAIIEAWLEKEKKGGRWVPSRSPYRCQLHVATGDRVCVDYRPLNDKMIGDQWPIPNLREFVHKFAQYKYLTSLDMPKGYNQILVRPDMRKYLAAEILGELYEPTVMQFGSKTAVAWFQRIVAWLLRDRRDRVGVYLDNIVIGTNDSKEHDEILAWVLSRLIEAGFPLSPTKCEWKKDTVLVGGYYIGCGKIRCDPAKLDAITNWPEPTEFGRAELATWSRRFIGFVNFLKDSFKNMSGLAAPLTELQKKDTTRTWDAEAKASFKAIKELSRSAPILSAVDHRFPLCARTDASDKGLGAHYYQIVDGRLRTTGFFSRKLNPAQQRYHTTERELMAIVYALEHARKDIQMTKGRPQVFTDHKALVKFMEKKKWLPRLERWGAALLEFMPDIQYIPGEENTIADALSRQWGGELDTHEVQVLTPRMMEKMVRRLITELGNQEDAAQGASSAARAVWDGKGRAVRNGPPNTERAAQSRLPSGRKGPYKTEGTATTARKRRNGPLAPCKGRGTTPLDRHYDGRTLARRKAGRLGVMAVGVGVRTRRVKFRWPVLTESRSLGRRVGAG